MECLTNENSENIIESVEAPEDEPPWSPTIINIFLDECYLKRRDLRNPRYSGNFFAEIRMRMLERGFNFTAKSLESVFHDLKNRFDVIRVVTTNLGPHIPVQWPYYGKIMAIYDIGPGVSGSSKVTSIEPEQSLSNENSNVNRSPLVYECNSSVVDEIAGREESQWCNKSVVAFLNECCKRKYDLWNPQIRRRKLFSAIQRELKAKGYHFSPETLDRKLRNLKKHFLVLAESAQYRRSTITWPYYGLVEEIYGNAMAEEMQNRKALMRMPVPQTDSPSTARPSKLQRTEPSCVTPPQQYIRNIKPAAIPDPNPSPIDPIQFIKNLPEISTDEFDSSTDDDSPRIPSATEFLFDENFAGDRRSVLGETVSSKFLSRIVELEERRTIATEQLVQELSEANRISRKKAKLLRIKLMHLMEKKKTTNENM